MSEVRRLTTINCSLPLNIRIRFEQERWELCGRQLGHNPGLWADKIEDKDGLPRQDLIVAKFTEHFIAKQCLMDQGQHLVRFLERLSQHNCLIFLHRNVTEKTFNLALQRRLALVTDDYHAITGRAPGCTESLALKLRMKAADGTAISTAVAESYVGEEYSSHDWPLLDNDEPKVRYFFKPSFIDDLAHHSPTDPSINPLNDSSIAHVLCKAQNLAEIVRNFSKRTYSYSFNYQIEEILADYLVDPGSALDHLRLFIPSKLTERVQAERLLELLRSYCITIGLTGLEIVKRETPAGLYFVFRFKDGEAKLEILDMIIREFQLFCDISAATPDEAVRGLRDAGIAEAKAEDLVSHVKSELQRIHIDLDYRRKRALLEVERTVRDAICSPVEDIRIGSNETENSSAVQAGVAKLTSQFIFVESGYAFDDDFAEQIRELIDSLETGTSNATLVADLATITDVNLPRSEKLRSHQRLRRFLDHHKAEIKSFFAEVIAKFIDLQIG